MSESLIVNLKGLLPVCLAVTEPSIDWKRIESEYPDLVLPLQNTMQDKDWHGEGDVWTHTKMVVEELTHSLTWLTLDETVRIRLFLAALLHDMGKPATSRTEEGHIVSTSHARIGAQDARLFLWNRLGLNTNPSFIRFREEIVSLVRRHSLPLHLLERTDPLLSAVEFSMLGNNEELATLCESDFRGRIGNDLNNSLEKIELFRMFVEEHNILNKAYPFASKHSAFGYFQENSTIRQRDSTMIHGVKLSSCQGFPLQARIHS